MLVWSSVDAVSSFLTAVIRFSDIVTKSEHEEMVPIALDIVVRAIFDLNINSAVVTVVWTVSILSGRSEFRPDGFNTVWTV